MVRDPVCHEPVDPDVTPWQCSYLGETWHFCSLGCQEQFERNPTAYAAPALAGRANNGGTSAAAAPSSAPPPQQQQ